MRGVPNASRNRIESKTVVAVGAVGLPMVVPPGAGIMSGHISFYVMSGHTVNPRFEVISAEQAAVGDSDERNALRPGRTGPDRGYQHGPDSRGLAVTHRT